MNRNGFFHYRAICLVTALLLAFFLSHSEMPLATISLPLEDCKFRIRDLLGKTPPPPVETVVVAVDEKSINRLGRWPWDRRILGILLGRLSAAQMIGMDIVFSEPAGPEQDGPLANAIGDSGNVILGFFFRSEASTAGTAEGLDALIDSAYREVRLRDPTAGIRDFPFAEVNLPSFSAGAAGCGFFNTEPDADGLYRRYPLVYLHQGYPFPSLAVQLQRFSLNREAELILDRKGVAEFALGETRVRDASHLRLNFYRPDPETFVSAVDVIDGLVPPDYFRDRLVLVGVTEMGIYDVRPTPMDPVTPGVWLHLTALGNLLQNIPLREAWALDFLVAAAALLLVTCISIRSAFRQRVLLYLAVLAGVVTLANVLLITRHIWMHEFAALFPGVGLALSLESFAFLAAERRARELKRAFAAYVSPEVVQEIIEHPEKLGLGGTEREVTALFCDIRDFTKLSEQLSPVQLVGMLTEIHDPLTGDILRRKGMLDKYIGDAMMALFNAPAERVEHPDLAVHAALDMVKTLAAVNRGFRARDLPEVAVGIGINTGACLVGNMGSRERFEYTAIGDAVNLASRLEGLCKLYGCRILISEFTCRRLQGEFVVRALDRVRVKGKDQPVVIYEVMEDMPRNRKIREHFARALEKYWESDFASAGAAFARLAEETGDTAASIFAERCRDLQLAPPGPDWDGVHVLQTK